MTIEHLRFAGKLVLLIDMIKIMQRNCRWHQQYSDLLNRKKAAIQRWKDQREIAKAAQQDKIEKEKLILSEITQQQQQKERCSFFLC